MKLEIEAKLQQLMINIADTERHKQFTGKPIVSTQSQKSGGTAAKFQSVKAGQMNMNDEQVKQMKEQLQKNTDQIQRILKTMQLQKSKQESRLMQNRNKQIPMREDKEIKVLTSQNLLKKIQKNINSQMEPMSATFRRPEALNIIKIQNSNEP